MLSYLHELLILLFRNGSTSAAELLRKIDVRLPEYDEVCFESTDLSTLRPTEYRADLVLFLVRGLQKVLGVIVEVQLARDGDKRYAWPAYVANLRARHRCPVCLLVITVEETVARWARKPIELGPGSRCNPWVVGPSNTPMITELQEASANVELAVLSAIEHGQSSDVELATRIVSTAIVASAGVDAERSRLYLDMILLHFSKGAPEILEAAMKSFGYKYPQSDFARRYIAEGRVEGKAEGKAEGKLEIVLKILTMRFGPLTESVRVCIQHASGAQLDAVVERALTVQTPDEVMSLLR